MAGAFLDRLLGSDDILLELYEEARETKDTGRLDEMENAITHMEEALSDLIGWAKRAKDELQGARSRLAWKRMGGVQESPGPDRL